MGIVIANIIAIYRRELQSYFVSPLAYGVASAFWFLAGLFFVMILLGPEGILVTVSSYDLQGQQMGVSAPTIDVPYEFVRAFLDRMGMVNVICITDSLNGTLCRRTQTGNFRTTSHIADYQLGCSCG